MALEQQILEYLVNDWKTRSNDIVDEKAFIMKFGDRQNVRDVLKSLKLRGYINVSYADDTIYLISLTEKFKRSY